MLYCVLLRMAEDVDTRERKPEDPPRLVGWRSKAGVRRSHHELELTTLVSRHVDPAVGEDVRFDPFDEPEASGVDLVEPIDLVMLGRESRHRDAVCDRQPVGVIRHGRILVPARQPRFDDDLQRLAAITVGGVHLQIAAIVLQRRSAKLLILESLDYLRAAEKRAAQFAALLDGASLSAFSDRALDRGRSAGVQHFQDHARRGGADLGNLA